MGHPEKYKKCLAYFEKKGYNREQALLLFRKGVLPYDYIVSCDKFSETSLPSIEKFTSVLNGKISQDDYIHAQNVWNAFDCKNLGEYQDIYLTTDVLLLSDVWETFRKMSMKYYELDPSHYISAPSLSWDAMMKYTGVDIELFTEGEMDKYDFVEKAKRDGITMACQRFFKM